jgi:hypothetical protein
MVMMVKIANDMDCFVMLWRMLGRTRRLCRLHCKRFCIRRVLQLWFGGEATEEFIWQVCRQCELCGWDELPPPQLYPRQHRELLRAIVAVRTGISFYKIDLKALDAAYSTAYPRSTPLNVNKKKRAPQNKNCDALIINKV